MIRKLVNALTNFDVILIILQIYIPILEKGKQILDNVRKPPLKVQNVRKTTSTTFQRCL